jgi:hypothetical protein
MCKALFPRSLKKAFSWNRSFGEDNEIAAQSDHYRFIASKAKPSDEKHIRACKKENI